MPDDYAWMDKLGAPAASKAKADDFAWMDAIGAKPAAAPATDHIPGLHDPRSSLLKPQPRSFSASDEELGISSAPAENDKRLISGGEARQLGRPRVHTTTELEGDPIASSLVAGAEGAVVAAPIAGLAGLAAPAAAPLVGGAVSGGVSTAAQGGDAADVAGGALIGSLFAVPAAGRAALANAGKRIEGRMQTDITGGSRGTAAKQVYDARAILDDTLEAHPDLKKTLQTSSSVAEKANAVSAKLSSLTDENDVATDAIAKHHGKIATERPVGRLQDLAERFEAAGDEAGRDAVHDAIETIDSFSKGSGAITAQQLRGIRNGLANTIAKKAPGLPPDAAKAAAVAIRAELNETIADLAGDTPGVDVDALKARNKQIASLIPVRTTLQEQARAQGLAAPHDTAAELIEPHGARKMVAKKVRETRAKADYALANSDTAKAVFAPTEADRDIVTRFPREAGRATAAGFLGARSGAVDYAANVAQGMKNGLTLEQAVAAAKAAEDDAR